MLSGRNQEQARIENFRLMMISCKISTVLNTDSRRLHSRPMSTQLEPHILDL